MNISKNNFADWVINKNSSDKIFCVDSLGNSISYKDLGNKVRSFSSVLKHIFNIQPQQRIGIYIDDTIEWPIAFLSCIYIGANPLLLYKNLLKKDVKKICSLADCEIIISKSTDDIEGIVYIDNLFILNLNDSYRLGDNLNVLPYDFHKDEMCWWALSSGSTGEYKCIVNRHGSFEDLYNVANKRVGITENSKVLCVAKMAFAWGLAHLMWVLSNNATLFLIAGVPAPTIIFKMLHQHNITMMCLSPYILNAMCKKKDQTIPSITKIISSGEPLSKHIRNKVKNTFNKKIFDGYGTSEIWSAISIQEEDNVSFDNIGSVITGIDYKIINEKGVKCKEEEPGELYVKHPAQALMYWKDKKSTYKTFRGDWVRTGDKVFEKENKLVFLSRLDDILKIKGLFVSPIEIENVILNYPQVESCVVSGTKNSDGLMTIHGFIVLSKNNKNFDLKLLKKYMKEELPAEKIPTHINIINEIPKTINNKTKRNYFVDLKV